MPSFTFKQANRRYRMVFWPVMVFYSVFCFAGPALLDAMGDPPKWVVAIVAVLTGAPIAIVLLLMGRLLRETDEYTRARQTEAMLTGGGLTLSFAAIWGFLELFEVAPHFNPFLLAPGFFGSYGLTTFAQRVFKRDGAGC
jgi:hypothetical protein